MAKTDRFMIAPLNGGLQKDTRPWLIPDDAFEELTNAYVFRGRVRKRFGSYLMNGSVSAAVAPLYSRLRIEVGTTNGAGALSGTVPGAIFEVGQMFSVGDNMFTVYQTGTPAAMKVTGAGSGTFNTTTGAFAITGAAAATDVFFYPAQPVMGITVYESAAVNDEPVYAFDTQFAYQYTSGAWERLSAEAAPGDALWSGDDSQFFWASTYRGITAADYYLFVSNFNTSDGLRYWNGTQWATLNPAFNSGGDTITTARIVVPFKDRLVLLNTIENISASDTAFVNRCRYSQNGSPVQSDAWREDIPGKGGYIDAPTKEAIVTVEFLKDRLIVYFERSTWELAYTGNEILPFRWQQINTELGAESTFSIVPFDKVAIGVGNVGIHACNGSNVERIDQKIPDSVFQISNDNEGVYRVYGIRDYYVEMVYWTFPSTNNDRKFPNRVLVYNYRTGSWAFNQDSITAFGYYNKQDNQTWASSSSTWQESIETWDSGEVQSRFRQVIAGNQEGFMFIIDADQTRNAPGLQITNMTASGNTVTITAVNHNLTAGLDYVIIENAQGSTGLNNTIFNVDDTIDDNRFTVSSSAFSGTYLGGGTVARVSNPQILTKQYNFYVDQGLNAMINKVDFLVDRTYYGEITVDYEISSSTQSQLEAGAASGALLGNGVLETRPYTLASFEFTQDRLWHPIYPMANGECIQLRMFLNDEQIRDRSIAWSDFELHAMVFYTASTSRLQ